MPSLRQIYASILVCAFLLAVPTESGAFGFIDSFRGGTALAGAGAYSAALGGSSSTYLLDASAIFLNPAGLSSLEGPSVSLGGSALGWKEIHRYGVGRELRSDRITGMRSVAAAMPIGGGIVVAAGMAAVADADYAGARYLLDPISGDVTGQEILYASGTQWDAVGGISYEPLEGLYAGLSAGFRTGSIELDYFRYDDWLGMIDSVMTDTLEVSEPAVRAGLMKVSDLTTLGVCYSAGGECLAPVLSGGFSVVAPHIQNVRVGIEGDLVSPLGRNDYAGRLQIEYPIAETTEILAGVSFSEQPSETGSGMGFSLGGSQTAGMFRFITAMHWQTKKVYGSYVEGEDADRVDDSTTEFIIGVSILP